MLMATKPPDLEKKKKKVALLWTSGWNTVGLVPFSSIRADRTTYWGCHRCISRSYPWSLCSIAIWFHQAQVFWAVLLNMSLFVSAVLQSASRWGIHLMQILFLWRCSWQILSIVPHEIPHLVLSLHIEVCRISSIVYKTMRIFYLSATVIGCSAL